MAILNSATGGSTRGFGRGSTGFTTTAFLSAFTAVRALSFAFGLTLGCSLGVVDALGEALGDAMYFAPALLEEILSVLGSRSPRTHMKPRPHTATSSTTNAAIPNLSRTGERYPGGRGAVPALSPWWTEAGAGVLRAQFRCARYSSCARTESSAAPHSTGSTSE